MEDFKQASFPAVEAQLLLFQQAAPECFRDGYLKQGKRRIVLGGLHGKIDFDIQDYEDAAGQRTNDLALSGQFTDHQDSVGLQAFVCKYANRLSYGDVAELLEDMTGRCLMSRSHACQLVESSANKVVLWEGTQRAGQQLSIPFLDKVDIYDSKQAEWLLFEDAIGVKKQKQRRVAGYVKSDKTVQIDVIVAQNGLSRDEFSTFVAGKDNGPPLRSKSVRYAVAVPFE